MAESSVINDLFNALAETNLIGRRKPRRASRAALVEMIETLLAGRGEASSTERAAEFLHSYRDLDSAGRTFVLRTLADDYGPDARALETAASAYVATPDQNHAKALQKAAEPRRVEVFRRLANVRGGMQALVALRQELLEKMRLHGGLWVVDDDLKRLFGAWFNRGFLRLREIDWQTSAAILEKIIRYEAVHAITDWDDLRRRIDVPDRRLFGFFHPRLGDEPLIFVEVALTKEMPGAIGPILAAEREPIAPTEATAAVFYSISNCQEGLRGISFGSFLIKQVAGDLAKELPNLRTFATLSPVPGFARWLTEMAEMQQLSAGAQSVLARIAETPDWLDDQALAKAAEAELMPLAAHYLTVVRDTSGRPRDPVARFHLGNGARLERVNFAADPSPRGMAGAHAIMVNYRYVLSEVEANHEAFMAEGKVITAPAVKRLAQKARFAEASRPAETPPPARLEAPAKH